MKLLSHFFILAILLISAGIAQASQLIPIEANKINELSDTVVVATVKSVEQYPNNTIPKEITDYDIITAEVAFVLKGSVSTKTLKIRLATRGNRAFDPVLKINDTATFFLKESDSGNFRTAYPGSIAIFSQHYFSDNNK